MLMPSVSAGTSALKPLPRIELKKASRMVAAAVYLDLRARHCWAVLAEAVLAEEDGQGLNDSAIEPTQHPINAFQPEDTCL
jgi:hypothetical protein